MGSLTGSLYSMPVYLSHMFSRAHVLCGLESISLKLLSRNDDLSKHLYPKLRPCTPNLCSILNSNHPFKQSTWWSGHGHLPTSSWQCVDLPTWQRGVVWTCGLGNVNSAKWSWQAADVDLATWSWQCISVNLVIQQSKLIKSSWNK